MRAYEACIVGLMGNNIEIVRETKEKVSPFSGSVFTTILNPEKLQKRNAINGNILPYYTATAILIYLTNRTLGHDAGNVEPIFTATNDRAWPEGLSDNQVGTLVEYCAHVLFLSFKFQL